MGFRLNSAAGQIIPAGPTPIESFAKHVRGRILITTKPSNGVDAGLRIMGKMEVFS
jgi:hypothetical protein